MELNDINPYLRFAQILNYKPTNEFLCAVDYHFYFMLSNYCRLKIIDTDYILQAGSAVVIPPGIKYLFDTQTEVKLISINFDYTQNYSHCVKEVHPLSADEFNPNSIIEKVYFENYPFLNRPSVIKNVSYLSEYANSVINEFIYKKQLYKAAASAIFKNIIISIARDIIFDGKDSDVINKILDYIHRNYSENIDNEILSHLAGYHPYHLNRLMKKATGTTMRQYLINYRIDAAKHYLRDTNYQISKISEMCGYNNFCNFSSDFKRKTGLTPSSYRLETQHLL